jgi:hypothetical protein
MPQLPPSLRSWRSPEKEQDAASNLTLFRAANFFVRVFAPRSHLTRNGTMGIQQERMRWAWAQQQRLLAAQTRFLPRIDTFSVSLRREIPIPVLLEERRGKQHLFPPCM